MQVMDERLLARRLCREPVRAELNDGGLAGTLAQIRPIGCCS